MSVLIKSVQFLLYEIVVEIHVSITLYLTSNLHIRTHTHAGELYDRPGKILLAFWDDYKVVASSLPTKITIFPCVVVRSLGHVLCKPHRPCTFTVTRIQTHDFNLHLVAHLAWQCTAP